MKDFNDFGFSALDAAEIASPQAIAENERMQKEIEAFYAELIVPMFDRLTQNPKKEYLQWPTRAKDCEAMHVKIRNRLGKILGKELST